MTELPSWLSSGIATIAWPLDEASHPPLHLKTLEEAKKIRVEEDGDTCTCLRSTTLPCTLESFQEFVAHLPESLEWILSDKQGEDRAYTIISLSFVLIGNGFPDEAHSLLAPLSYPTQLPFGYGPCLYSKISDEARSFASYGHGLVHRREGPHVGEFQQSGFENANYWSSIVCRSPGVEALPHEELCRKITHLVEEYESSVSIQQWFSQSGFEFQDEEAYFEARWIHSLCQQVLKNGGKDAQLQQFAEQACEMEIRVLLRETLQRAGFATTQDSL